MPGEINETVISVDGHTIDCKCERCNLRRNYSNGWNDCHDEFTAWLAGNVNVEGIGDLISHSDAGLSMHDMDGSREDKIKRLAEAIVASILGKE